MRSVFPARSVAFAVAIAITTACARHTGAVTAWTVRFGPVIGDEAVVGRVASGATVWLATGRDALLAIDLDAGRFTRSSISGLADGEHIWGLASAGDDEMWTLVGRNTLAQVGEDGAIRKRVALSEPHVGVYGAGRELLYQVMNFHPPADALTAGPPGGARRHTWSRMRTRVLPLARGAVAALNLVACGPTASDATPCWFPDQAAITLTDLSGASRDVTLEGLPVVAPEILLAAENPPRPVRDAFVSAGNDVWVLGSGQPPAADVATRPGGWLLARYDSAGRLFRRVQLPEPARLILAVHEDRCVLLAWDGRVVEVRP